MTRSTRAPAEGLLSMGTNTVLARLDKLETELASLTKAHRDLKRHVKRPWWKMLYWR